MSDELVIRLSELRAAAAQFRQSALAIRESLESAQSQAAEMSALLPLPLPAATSLLTTAPNASADRLDTLRDQLTRAVDALDEAVRPVMIPLGILWNRLDRRPVIRPDPIPEIGMAAYTLGSYISRYNRPLYNIFLNDQAAITRDSALIEQLRAERERTQGDFIALQNRLATAGITPTGTPQVRAFEGQLAHLDREEAAAQARIEAAQTRVDNAREHLLMVTPPDDADSALIRSLEGGKSESYVLTNTRDCVNYIVGRVPIPGELAANAHLWDEKAAELTRFGIRVGNQPLTGSILVMETDHPYASDDYGHVMLVESVGSDGSVWVTDHTHPNPVRLSDLTDEVTGARMKYLYLPWYTRAG